MIRAVAVLICALTLIVTTQASADAVVRVKVHGAEEGQVKLSGEGGTFTCTISQGSCTIASVPGGRYVAVFKPRGGEATSPKKVMIPPNGTADLHITAK
jgi:hypothetical protein